MRYLLLAVLGVCVPQSVAAAESAFAAASMPLEDGFKAPPSQARPQTWWHWMNGNVTREGITADLESMAQAGLGGALIFNLAGPEHLCDTPPGPADYLGPLWLDLMKHAATEAERLGLELGMHNCAGWATTGGPWITPELAMQQLVSSETTLDGGRHMEIGLPRPEVNLGFYRDIAVFAVPAEADTGFRLSKWEAKAGQRASRADRQPELEPLPENSAIPLESIICVTEKLRNDGTLVWDAPPGRWKIIRLGHTPTGATNAPAPAAATGLEIDKLRREGLDVHWQHGIQPLLNHLGPLVGKTFRHVTIDSYEAGLHHWTPRMREEFGKRRGYDPTPYLLALTGRVVADGPATERFLWDFRRTIADLFANNYYGYMADLCHKHGLLFTTEPYTSCFEGLQVGGKADIPMAEFWANGNYSFSVRLAASLAHVHRRPIAAAEAFTAAPPLGRWLDSPASLKRVGDLAWTEGINRLVFHRYTHQPWLDLAPGMTMGQYGIHFERTNTWWKPGRAWLDYIARSQFLLQSGESVADVLCFAGNAAPNGAVYMNDLKRSGHDYDSCGTDILANLTVSGGDVVVPSGRHYRLLVLPNHAFHTAAFARKLRDLVQAGATVLGPKPQLTPSLEKSPASESEVRDIGEEVWGTCDGKSVKTHTYGEGRVFNGMSPAEVLTTMGVPASVKTQPDGAGLAWIHRHVDGTDLFFVSNQSATAVRTTAGFRVLGKMPELWDPVSGTIRRAAGWTAEGAHTHVPLELAPEESVFVVFREPGMPEADPYVRADGPSHPDSAHVSTKHPAPRLVAGSETHLRVLENGMHTLVRASGKTDKIEVTGLPQPLTITGPWTLSFQPNRGAPNDVRFEKLMSWTDHADPGIRYFSGTASYLVRFDLPKDYQQDHSETWLDLGAVSVIAEVRLNGKNLGVLWHSPFRVDASKALQPGANSLEIDVSNLWVNRLIGDEQHPDDCEWTGKALTRWPDWLDKGTPRPATNRFTFTTWKHWTASDPLLPSGLLGPVTLHPARLWVVEKPQFR
jgi:alpha-L-rhamnosidase